MQLETSLLGVADPVKFLDTARLDSVHPPAAPTSRKYTVVIIVISAVIFITAVAVYEVLRGALALAMTTDDTFRQGLEKSLLATCVFAAVCFLLALVVIPLLLQMC